MDKEIVSKLKECVVKMKELVERVDDVIVDEEITIEIKNTIKDNYTKLINQCNKIIEDSN